MKTINVSMDDDNYKVLKLAKGHRTWIKFLMEKYSPKDEGEGE